MKLDVKVETTLMGSHLWQTIQGITPLEVYKLKQAFKDDGIILSSFEVTRSKVNIYESPESRGLEIDPAFFSQVELDPTTGFRLRTTL